MALEVDTREAEQLARTEKGHAREGNGAAADAFVDVWLTASGAPQIILHRCSCGCRFSWPTNARRIETRVEGVVEEAIELAYCPACKSVCLRLLAKHSLYEHPTHESDAQKPNRSPASVEESRESAANALAAALIKTSRGDITRQEDLIPALHTAENVIDAIADYVLARQGVR